MTGTESIDNIIPPKNANQLDGLLFACGSGNMSSVSKVCPNASQLRHFYEDVMLTA